MKPLTYRMKRRRFRSGTAIGPGLAQSSTVGDGSQDSSCEMSVTYVAPLKFQIWQAGASDPNMRKQRTVIWRTGRGDYYRDPSVRRAGARLRVPPDPLVR